MTRVQDRRPPHLVRAAVPAAALVMASSVLLAPPAAADTGGKRLAYTVAGHAVRIAAAKQPVPGKRVRKVPAPWHIALSPDGHRVAVARPSLRSSLKPRGTEHHLEVVLSTPDRRHSTTLWHVVRGPKARATLSPDGLSWSADGKHLYVGVQRSDQKTFRDTWHIVDIRLRKDGTVKSRHTVPGSKGLTQPARSPRGNRLAAIHQPPLVPVTGETQSTETRVTTLVTLNLKTGKRTELYRDSLVPTVPKESLHYLTQPAWSPDGSRIAFVDRTCCAGDRYTSVIRTADPKRPGTTRIAADGNGTWTLSSPTWRSADELWFARSVEADGSTDSQGSIRRPGDLFSTRWADGRFQPPRNRTSTPHRDESMPSFG